MFIKVGPKLHGNNSIAKQTAKVMRNNGKKWMLIIQLQMRIKWFRKMNHSKKIIVKTVTDVIIVAMCVYVCVPNHYNNRNDYIDLSLEQIPK